MSARVTAVFSLLTCLAFVGCGGGGAGGSLSGTVKFDDGSPLTKGVVVFDGEGSFRATIDSDGGYKLDEIKPGDYRIAITGALSGGDDPGEMKYDEEGNYIEPPAGAEPKSLIDEKYSSLETSGLTAKVESGSGTHDIEVTKPAP